MNMLPKKQNLKKTKLVIAGCALISFAVLATGGFLFNPFCIAAGVGGLFLSCSMMIALKKPPPSHPYV